MHVLIQLQNSNWFIKKTCKCCFNFKLNHINAWRINYNQYTQNKIENKLRTKAIDHACFKLEQKAIRKVKKNKNIFIIIIGDKFAMWIRRGKLIILFCKKLISYLYKYKISN